MHLSINSISRRLINFLITPDKFFFWHSLLFLFAVLRFATALK